MKLKKRLKLLINVIGIFGMKKSELTVVQSIANMAAKLKAEYTAFIAEVAAKQDQLQATIQSLVTENEALKAMIADEADPTEVQASLDRIAALHAEMDSFRVDLPAAPVDPVPEIPVDEPVDPENPVV